MIALIDNYFTIDDCTADGEETVFSVTLKPQYCAYKGHFPGNPVSPGVCNIQMIKECAERLVGKPLFLCYIGQCRFSAVMTPQKSPHLKIRMKLAEIDGIYKVKALVADADITYIEFKGELTLLK